MSGTSRVEKVVRSAWERRFLVVAVERTAIAVAVVLGALVVMLVLGTQILGWRWLVALGAVGLGIAAYQIRQRLIEHYRVAQQLDHRLELADSLSTAWYLLSRPDAQRNVCAQYQLRGAETAAQMVDVAAAFPFTGRRLWSIAGVFAFTAVSLFSLRYFVTNSLSLQPSLIPLRLSEVLERTDKDSEETRKQRQETSGTDKRSQKTTPKTEGQKDAKEQPRAEPPALAQGNAPGAGQNPNQPAEMQESKLAQDGKGKERSEGKAGTAQQSGEKQGEEGDQNSSQDKPSPEDQANSPKSSNGVVDRMKDALSSLAAKLRGNNEKRQDSNQRKSEDDLKGEQSSSKEQQNSQDQNSSNSSQSSDQQQAAEGKAQGTTQEKSRPGQGRSPDSAADKSKSDSHSGAGSQDGEKAAKEAEQLKAMGKLAEIIGKRSATATGEVMVENPSGRQRLQTEYSQRTGRHSNLGGEINRDEVPLMYQQYVREYMSQIRRQSRPKRRKK